MKVKNIKSFIEFYKNLGTTTSITNTVRGNSSDLLYQGFAINELEKVPTIKKYNENQSKQKKLEILKSSAKDINCDLKDIATNLVFSDGNINSEIMLIGEAPGAEEDRKGKPFVGEAGKLLDKMLSFIDLNREKNFYITNILFWRPPGNRTPNSKEISLCLDSTIEHIKIIEPKLLILVGGIATKALLKSQEGITKLRGISHYYCYDESKIHTRAIFHPTYLLRNPIEKRRMWDDLLEIDNLILKNNIRR